MRTIILPMDRLASRSRNVTCPVEGLVGDCWVTDSPNSSGYSQAWDGKRRWQAHRYAYTVMIEEIPAGLELDHLCRNLPCWNPWHTEPVTHRVNVNRGTLAETNSNRVVPSHCPKGHDYVGDNDRRDAKTGKRKCRECRRAYDAARLPRKR